LVSMPSYASEPLNCSCDRGLRPSYCGELKNPTILALRNPWANDEKVSGYSTGHDGSGE
jgi:hypothetical protein